MIDTEMIRMEVEAMIHQAEITTMRGEAQAIGSCIAAALKYDAFGIEACNLSDIATQVFIETEIDEGYRNLDFVIMQTIAQCASIKLDGKASRKDLFADPSDSNLMNAAGVSIGSGCNPIALIASLIFGGVRQLMIYPSTRGLGRRFSAGVATAALQNAKKAKGKK